MTRLTLAAAARVALAALVIACSSEPRSPDYCVVVEAVDAEGEALASVLGNFAAAEGMTNRGREQEPVFYTRDRSTEIVVTTFLGPLGASVSVNTLGREPDQALIERLRQFVRVDVEPRWRVRNCNEVPNLDVQRHS